MEWVTKSTDARNRSKQPQIGQGAAGQLFDGGSGWTGSPGRTTCKPYGFPQRASIKAKYVSVRRARQEHASNVPHPRRSC